MHNAKVIFRHWGPVIAKCMLAAIFAGSMLGIGSGVILEHFSHIDVPQLGIVLAVCLWFGTMVFAVFVVESMNRRRFKKFACVLVQSENEELQRRAAANHNRRYIV